MKCNLMKLCRCALTVFFFFFFLTIQTLCKNKKAFDGYLNPKNNVVPTPNTATYTFFSLKWAIQITVSLLEVNSLYPCG